MPRFRYDKDLDCVLEIREDGNYVPERRGKPRGVISDIEPYRAVASDVACDNKRPVIGGRRQHREFLRRNGYTEVGNDYVAPTRAPTSTQSERVNEIKRAMGEYGSNTGARR